MFDSDLGWGWRRPPPFASSQGKPGAWLVTDGYSSQAWSAAKQEADADAVGALGLEGPVNWCCWNDSMASQNSMDPTAFAVGSIVCIQCQNSVRPLVGSLNSVSTNW